MKFLLMMIGAVALPVFAADGGADLNPADSVGVSFWLVTAGMLAATVFFLVERDRVHGKWKTSLSVAALVTGIAFWHYLYMRNVWAGSWDASMNEHLAELMKGGMAEAEAMVQAAANAEGSSPTTYRYIDWLITVPLQIIEFFLILKVCTNVKSSVFWKLLIASLVMLVGGYMGEMNMADPMICGVVAMLAWLYIIYEVFAGEAGKLNASSGNAAAQSAFGTIRLIVTVGWAIYPIGYFLGIGENPDMGNSNLIYNLADFVNKIAFGLAIYVAAVSDSE
jgi:bacteriorhodopsin